MGIIADLETAACANLLQAEEEAAAASAPPVAAPKPPFVVPPTLPGTAPPWAKRGTGGDKLRSADAYVAVYVVYVRR